MGIGEMLHRSPQFLFQLELGIGQLTARLVCGNQGYVRMCHGMRAHGVARLHQRPSIVPGHHQVALEGKRPRFKGARCVSYHLCARRCARFRADPSGIQKGLFAGLRARQIVKPARSGIRPLRILRGPECVTQHTIPRCLRAIHGIDQNIECPWDAKAVENGSGEEKDNFLFAAPILNRFGIPGTFYVLVDAVDRSKAPWYCVLRHAFRTAQNPKWTDPATGRLYDLTGSQAREEAFLNAAGICAKSSASTRAEVVRNATRSLEPGPFPLESDLMMTWDDARTLVKSGHTVGSHTMTHPNVALVSADEARSELTDSKLKLEKELGGAVKHFSYPHPALNPQWNESTLKITEELGYETAVTTTVGAVRADSRPLAIPRTYIPREESEFLWHIERTLVFRSGAAPENHPGA